MTDKTTRAYRVAVLAMLAAIQMVLLDQSGVILTNRVAMTVLNVAAILLAFIAVMRIVFGRLFEDENDVAQEVGRA